MLNICRLFLVPVFLICIATGSVLAEESFTPQQKIVLRPFIDAANKAKISGPTTIQLVDQGTLDLPAGYYFIPQKESAALLNAIGSKTSPGFIGFIVPNELTLSSEEDKPGAEDWTMVLNYTKTGYIRDDDAKTWDTDKLLNAIRQHVEQESQNRVAKGFPAVDITGWVQPPIYDVTTHQLVFSFLAQRRGDSSPPSINYDTVTLGREGIFELNLGTDNNKIKQYKKHVPIILSAIHFKEGKRYQDFAEGTDRVAEFGLAALVTGVTAKKLGLIGLAGVFLAKIWKLLAVCFVIIMAKFRKIFRRDNSSGEKE